MHAGGVHHDAGMHRFGNVALRAFDVKNETRALHAVGGGRPSGVRDCGLSGIVGRSLSRASGRASQGIARRALGGLDAHNFTRKVEFDAVACRVFRSAERHLIRVANRARGNKQRAERLGRHVRLKLTKLLRANHAQALDAILLAALAQLANRLELVFRKSEHHRAIVNIRKPQFTRPLRVEFRAFHVIARLAGARLRVVARMHDSAVRARGAIGHVETGFKHCNFQCETSAFASHTAARNARSHNGDIHFAHGALLATVTG